MASTYTPLGIEKQATGENAGTWGTKTNTNLEIVEQISGGYTAQAVADSGDTTLSVSDGSTGATLAHRVIEFTGSLTASRNVTIPLDVQNFYFLKNATSGSQNVVFKYATGTGTSATVANGKTVIAYAKADDGTNPNISTISLTSDLVDDTTPQLGGNLDTNSFNIAFDDAHGINDENGNEQIIFQTTGSAVNQLDITNAATGSGPEISSTGGDTNIDLKLTPKGSGKVVLDGNVSIDTGVIDLKNGGTASKVLFYCESSNAHAQTVQSAPHSVGATNTLTLPGGTTIGNSAAVLVSDIGTQTLTNKTLTSPKVNEDVAVTSTATELNILDGVTSTTAELNILDGVTATAAEINYSDLATLGTTAASKVLTADANNFTKITGAVANEEATLTDGSTIAWDVIASPVAKVTLAGNRTLSAPSGSTPIAGQFIAITVIQDGSGSRTLTWNATYEFTADTAPTLTTTASKADLFVFKYNGSKWLETGRNLNLTIS